MDRDILVSIADGTHRHNDGTIWVPPVFGERMKREWLRAALRIEAAATSPSELLAKRRDFARASGDRICDQCGMTYRDHPGDVDGFEFAGLTILCNGDRVKL